MTDGPFGLRGRTRRHFESMGDAAGPKATNCELPLSKAKDVPPSSPPCAGISFHFNCLFRSENFAFWGVFG
jgi:hypothetical protein